MCGESPKCSAGFASLHESRRDRPMCKRMRNPKIFKVMSRRITKGVSLLREIALTAIHSYSYREDSGRDTWLLCSCAEPRKSPTIGQLQEMFASGVIWRDSCILTLKPIGI